MHMINEKIKGKKKTKRQKSKVDNRESLSPVFLQENSFLL